MKVIVAVIDAGRKDSRYFLYKKRGEVNSKKLRYPTKKEQ
jgi:hypothetical protein